MALLAESQTTFTFGLPNELRERARAICKKHRIAASQLIRDGLVLKLEEYEAKDRAEEERKRQEKLERKMQRGLGSSVLGPQPTLAAPTPLEPRRPEGPQQSPEETLYIEWAGRILACLSSPLDLRMRIKEATEAIKKRWPLTHPGDDQIVEHLERIVVRLRGEGPAPGQVEVPKIHEETPKESFIAKAARTFDEFVGSALNISKVKTLGDPQGPVAESSTTSTGE